MRGIRVSGWGIAVPDKVVTNDDMAARLDTSDEWIVERTGIRQRHIGGTTSGLAIEAGQAALTCAGAPDGFNARFDATSRAYTAIRCAGHWSPRGARPAC